MTQLGIGTVTREPHAWDACGSSERRFGEKYPPSSSVWVVCSVRVRVRPFANRERLLGRSRHADRFSLMGPSVPKEMAMKALGRVVSAGLLTLLMVASVSGCSKSAKNAMTESGSAAAASTGSSMAAAGMSLFQQLGGMSGVTKLAEAFGANIAANPILSKVLDAATIGQTKLGLVNEIAKASGMTAPNPGVDLLTTLSGKGLDASGVSALTNALSDAADKVHLKGPEKTAVMGLPTPITNIRAGQ